MHISLAKDFQNWNTGRYKVNVLIKFWQFFDFRSIYFEKEYLEPTAKFFQPAWVVNYPEVCVKCYSIFYLHYKTDNVQADVNFTRISEFKHAPNQPAGVKEHPGLFEIKYKRVFSP